MTAKELKRTANLGAELAVAMTALSEIRKIARSPDSARMVQAIGQIAENALKVIESESLPDTWEHTFSTQQELPEEARF